MPIKRSSFGTALWWLDGRRLTLTRYLQTYYPPYDWSYIKHFFYDNPIQAKVILSDFQKTNEAKLKEVAWLFVAGKSKIVYIVGARGSGKTATAFMFSETVHNETSRPIFYISATANKKALPKWCILVDSIQDVPKGALAMVDEASLQFNAREFMKGDNIDMSKLLAIARHKDIFLIFLTQDTSLADTNIRRLRDIVIWKQANDYNLSERGTKNSKEHKFWQKVRNMMSPRSKEECLFEFPAMKRFIHFSHELPDCWSEELSKVWADTNFRQLREKEAVEKKQIKKKKEVIYI